ncbi:hypothetical protein QJS10_CPA03g01296 [Acorus calamus]|uniref:Uncharacterized protein n=1 Tax=Acorus calamus TaxID=4465 RepID=A0AAV9FDF8_ACOCL|nr:hypothetical protein QJS10_CPA03g01296 [Acorus calamus]
MNKALLSKWKWRMLTCDTLLWKRAMEESEGGWVIGLQRALEDGEIEFLRALTQELHAKKVVQDCPDRAIWTPQSKKQFTVKGCYTW